MLEVGPMRHRVTVQRQSETRDNFGQDVNEWADLKTYWARLTTLTGRELEAARQVRADVSIRIVMRAGADVTAEDRLTHGGRIFSIASVIDPEERGRYLQIDCSEWKGAENP